MSESSDLRRTAVKTIMRFAISLSTRETMFNACHVLHRNRFVRCVRERELEGAQVRRYYPFRTSKARQSLLSASSKTPRSVLTDLFCKLTMSASKMHLRGGSFEKKLPSQEALTPTLTFQNLDEMDERSPWQSSGPQPRQLRKLADGKQYSVLFANQKSSGN